MNSTIHFYALVSASLYRGTDSEILQLFLNAGLMVKLVMLILLLCSIVCWAIIFYKHKVLHAAEKHTRGFFEILGPKKDLALLYSESKRFSASPVVAVFRAGYLEFNQLKRSMANKKENAGPYEDIRVEDKGSIERALHRAISGQIMRLERYLSFLATTGNTAPFIGLFGTVWGIMEAFQEIGQKGATSLAIVAPGISEALVATAAGLFAAIPAVIAYNYYVSRVRRLVSEMDSFASDLLNNIDRTL